jgi:hypothetical protein
MTAEARPWLASLLGGTWISQALYVAAELGIADALAAGPLDAADLAAAVDASSEPLARLLDALVAAGVFRRARDAAYENNDVSELLRSGVPGSLRAVARLGGHPAHWGAWGRLLDVVRTGGTAFDRFASEPFFDRLARDEGLRDIFQAVQAAFPEHERSVAAALPLGGARRIVDLGGGRGGLCRALAERFPAARVTLCDRPEVIADLAPDLPTLPFTVEAGNLFEAVPTEADAYLLKHVLHDWDDARALDLLRVCRAALGAAASLWIVEALLPPPGDPSPSPARAHDLNLLVLTGGRERTLDDYDLLAAAAGLRRAGPPRRAGVLSLLEYRALP